MLAVVVTVCYINTVTCREAIAYPIDYSTECSILSQPKIAQWKMNSIYHDDDWQIKRFRCEGADYKPKSST